METKDIIKLMDVYDNLGEIIIEEISKLPSFGETCECDKPIERSVTSGIRTYCLRCGGILRNDDCFYRD